MEESPRARSARASSSFSRPSQREAFAATGGRSNRSQDSRLQTDQLCFPSGAILSHFRYRQIQRDDALAQGDYLIGEDLTVADVVVASVLAISRRFGEAEMLPPRADAYLARMEQRPARLRAYAAFA